MCFGVLVLREYLFLQTKCYYLNKFVYAKSLPNSDVNTCVYMHCTNVNDDSDVNQTCFPKQVLCQILKNVQKRDTYMHVCICTVHACVYMHCTCI